MASEGEPATKGQLTSTEGASSLSIVVAGLAGNVCAVEASTDWTIFQVGTRSCLRQCKIPVLWQTFLKGPVKLAWEVTVGSLTTEDNGEELQLSLVKQEPADDSVRNLLQAQPDSCGLVAEDLVWVLLNGESRFHAQASESLLELARDRHHAGTLGRTPEVLEGLVSLLSEGCDLRRTCGVEALASVTLLAGLDGQAANARQAIARIPRALPLLVALFMDGSTRDKDMAGRVLLNAAWNAGNSVHDAVEAARMLVGLLKAGNMVEQGVAAKVLGVLTMNAQNRTSVACIPDALELLVALLGTGEGQRYKHAAQTLGNLALSSESQLLIARAPGAISSLVHLVANSPSAARQREAAHVLFSLAVSSSNHVTIRAAYCALVSLEELLAEFARRESNQQERRESDLRAAAAAAADTLAKLAQSSSALEATGTVHCSGGLELLLTLLDSGSSTSKEAAATALAKFATDPEDRVNLRRHPHAIRLLVQLLRTEGHQGQAAAARALWSLAWDDERTKAYLGFGWMGVIPGSSCSDRLRDREGRGGRRLALPCHPSPKNPERITTLPDVVPALVALLREGDEEGRREAAGALEILRKDPAVRAAIDQASQGSSA